MRRGEGPGREVMICILGHALGYRHLSLLAHHFHCLFSLYTYLSIYIRVTAVFGVLGGGVERTEVVLEIYGHVDETRRIET